MTLNHIDLRVLLIDVIAIAIHIADLPSILYDAGSIVTPGPTPGADAVYLLAVLDNRIVLSLDNDILSRLLHNGSFSPDWQRGKP